MIAVLSPANKRPGYDLAEAYNRKRRDILGSSAHLLEIDLLRGGQRPALTTPLPDAPYFLFLSRAAQRPRVFIWMVLLQQMIPVVPVPLQQPDPDVPLDLGAVLDQIYQAARYDLRLRYQADPPPPELSPDDAAWLDAHLRSSGLRS